MIDFKRHLGALAAGIGAVALLAGAALADPALIYDLGGKFDKSFNEAAYNGAEQWKKETGGTYHDLEIQAEAQREQAVRKFAQAGYSPIVVTGFSFADTLNKVAPDFPNIHFVQIDSVVDQPNVQSVVYKSNDASYLAGVLAAKTSKTGKVGFVGGMDIPLIHNFFCGYKEGFMATNKDGQVFENYTGTTAAAWNDPTTAGELTKADFDKGADIVYAAAGASGLGVIQAAKDAGKMSIGVDSNQNYIAPGSVLTSVLKRVDVTVYNAFKDGDAGFKPGVVSLGVAENGVGLAMDDNNKSMITPDAQAAVDAAAKGIADGTIKVHDYNTDNQCP
ncbi:MAG: BMP family ABC transporter substrate-binding protein [Devosia sp. 67-54]|uniref:BMP family lipoprotein n=1 Tax=unclassified Devosia TaxID=196773 RepID=UPI000961F205|nr:MULTISPECIES: BMP family ABC transporter substrate-binding protein [unclassified Devosia]MBN9304528.1 BMP family ABC transporter substrate-binding protein [Devosia sp.]OJX15474.1 MAG: BMP family ABC transporter substrate-binding protein [Devosia sp. 67-54]